MDHASTPWPPGRFGSPTPVGGLSMESSGEAMTINRTRFEVVRLVILTGLLAGCSVSNVDAARKTWCDANLANVGAAGTALGSSFRFASGDEVTWGAYLLDSEVEQGIVVAESIDGQSVWDAACDRAFIDAHPGESLEPLPSPS